MSFSMSVEGNRYLADINAALLRAAQKAWERSRRTKTPFVTFKDGRIVDLNSVGERSDSGPNMKYVK